MQELEVYSMIGAEGFTRLVAAFYRQVPQDDLLGPMYPAQDLKGCRAASPRFLDRSVRGAADLHRTERPSPPPCAAFSVPHKSDRPRPMDAFDEYCLWGSCAAGRGRRSPSKIPRWNVELYDQSGRAWSPLEQSDAPGCPWKPESLRRLGRNPCTCKGGQDRKKRGVAFH
jgi:hypothetical protein